MVLGGPGSSTNPHLHFQYEGSSRSREPQVGSLEGWPGSRRSLHLSPCRPLHHPHPCPIPHPDHPLGRQPRTQRSQRRWSEPCLASRSVHRRQFEQQGPERCFLGYRSPRNEKERPEFETICRTSERSSGPRIDQVCIGSVRVKAHEGSHVDKLRVELEWR